MFLLKRKINLILHVLAIICFGAEWDYTGTAYYVRSEDGGPQGIFTAYPPPYVCTLDVGSW